MIKNNSNYYLNLFNKYGESPKSLGWSKGKQFLRYDQLTRDCTLKNSSFLDVGCGFGDFASYLKIQKDWKTIIERKLNSMKFFGTTFHNVANNLGKPILLGDKMPKRNRQKVIGLIIVSTVLVSLSLFWLITGTGAKEPSIAMLGMVAGYWLR